ncbi:hypothetical protein P186_0485 [Pyrobaculum ferrireducens]|uniref:Uncharacterized protein n=1 Tax=Pyrobaculum ferrireducens TaxID=1104324 RepID=G7VGV4_9CREN|nr:hypothetical protein P186_0485 [Pyrobaculum ferrireducens]
MPRRGVSRIGILIALGFLLLFFSLFIAFQQSYRQAHCGEGRCVDPLFVLVALFLLIAGAVILLYSVTIFINVKIEENLKRT